MPKGYRFCAITGDREISVLGKKRLLGGSSFIAIMKPAHLDKRYDGARLRRLNDSGFRRIFIEG